MPRKTGGEGVENFDFNLAVWSLPFLLTSPMYFSETGCDVNVTARGEGVDGETNLG